MRRGISILEVLFAIVIVSIGLLAALSVFPVAAALARKGQVADMAAIAGRSAVHDFDVRGMRQTARWLAWNPVAGDWQNYQPAFGESYCIDPRAIAAPANASAAGQVAISAFPYSASATQPKMRRLTLDRMNGYVAYPPTSVPAMDWPEPFNDTPAHIDPAGILAGPLPSGLPMTALQANSIFMFEDDLTFGRPKDRSLPAFGEIAGGQRGSGGHFSWMATLSPVFSFDSLPGQGWSADYTLSVIIFHDRPADMEAGDPRHERVVGVDWNEAGGLGYAGGETLLFAPTGDELTLHAGDWLMLSGMANHITGAKLPVFGWYSVLESDEPAEHPADNRWECPVSLSGGDWDAATLINQQAIIVEGVVAVYTRTVKLNSLAKTE